MRALNHRVNSSWTGGAFDWCVALKEVSLPSTLTEIGGITFRDCYSLESITLPENLKLLGADQYRGYVFTNCTALKSVNLPYNVSVIEQNCFQGCTALESIDLSYVETVDQGAFTGCTALKEIKFGQYMNKIYNTFHNLDSLETVTLDGVDLQVQNCFQDCPALKKLVISADVKSITGSFRKCDALSEIEVAPENPYLYASGGILYTADLKTLVLIAAGIENVDIPDSVTGGTLSSVPNGIKSVTFGMGLTNFEGSCRWFSGCKTLETVTIKNASARVVYCFDNCTALRELNVNEGCTGFMMGGCTALKRLVVPSTATQFSFENMDVPELIIADGNETLAMEGNVLYNKNTNQLLLVLNKSSVTIPSGVTWNYQITADNVTMGDGVPSISGVYVRQAKTVTLDADLEHIGDYVFYQCPGMTDLYILGDSITFGDYAFGDGECTQEIRVHSNIPGEFLSNVVGPTFVYLSGLGVDVVMNTGDHVSVEDYPAPKADEGGSISFTAHAEKGYVLKVTATGGTVASDNGVYTISAIPAAGTTVSLSADYVGIISEKVELERRHLTVMVGDAIAIGFAVTPFDSTEAVVWTSSDPSVVKVGDDGIKAVAGGKATLTATSGSQTATCEVTVNAPNVGPSDDTKSDSGSDNTLVISLGGCIAVLAIVGIACVLIRRRA